MNLRTFTPNLLRASVSLETLRKEHQQAYVNHIRNGEEVDRARRALETAERQARISRRRWMDLGAEINRIEKERNVQSDH